MTLTEFNTFHREPLCSVKIAQSEMVDCGCSEAGCNRVCSVNVRLGDDLCSVHTYMYM